jgi:molecular chaperone GrpE
MTDDTNTTPENGETPEGAAAAESSAEDIVTELLDTKRKLAYLAAEFDNYRKRTTRERESLVAFGNERLLLALLPILDNLERAIAQGAASGSADALLEGVRMTYGLFVAELRKFGVEQMTAAGQPFDPSIHEAIAQLPAPHVADGTVLDEACKGYTLNSRLLRAAQVTVARGGETPKPGGEGR